MQFFEIEEEVMTEEFQATEYHRSTIALNVRFNDRQVPENFRNSVYGLSPEKESMPAGINVITNSNRISHSIDHSHKESAAFQPLLGKSTEKPISSYGRDASQPLLFGTQ